jgi:putative zinc finger/helix-turn-helix YgiT family protein
MKKCRECGSAMESRREPYKYDASGLDGVVLENTLIHRCPNCGDYVASIERMEELHRELAQTLARRPERLTPKEIRFMRKWLGYSSSEFAGKMGVNPSTVSRWESASVPQPMGGTAERLLRLMVLQEKPVSSYPLDEMATMEAKPIRLRVASGRNGWQVTADAPPSLASR